MENQNSTNVQPAVQVVAAPAGAQTPGLGDDTLAFLAANTKPEALAIYNRRAVDDLPGREPRFCPPGAGQVQQAPTTKPQVVERVPQSQPEDVLRGQQSAPQLAPTTQQPGAQPQTQQVPADSKPTLSAQDIALPTFD